MLDWIASLIMGLGVAMIILALGGNMESGIGKFIKSQMIKKQDVGFDQSLEEKAAGV